MWEPVLAVSTDQVSVSRPAGHQNPDGVDPPLSAWFSTQLATITSRCFIVESVISSQWPLPNCHLPTFDIFIWKNWHVEIWGNKEKFHCKVIHMKGNARSFIFLVNNKRYSEHISICKSHPTFKDSQRGTFFYRLPISFMLNPLKLATSGAWSDCDNIEKEITEGIISPFLLVIES